MVSNEVLIVIGIVIVGVLGYIGLMAVPHQLVDLEKYAHAPVCNNQTPTEPGICKLTDTTWIVCETEYNIIQDTNTLNCKEINKYGV
jgi:hypothetical protein